MYVDALERGTRVGELEVRDVIGQGGFGIVYTADHSFLGEVALKEFFPKSQASRALSGQIVPSSPNKADGFKQGVQRLIKEGKKLQDLQHPGVVQVFGVFESNGSAYLVMKRIAGMSLQEAIEKKHLVASRAQLDDFCRQMLDALDAVHRVGLVHRDVAPDNILMEHGASTPRFVLIDFGGAKRVVSDATEESSASLTKSGFSPPEQYANEANGGLKASPATDIYALCATVYWLVSGRRPMDAPTRTAVDTITQLSRDAALIKIYGKEWLAAIDKGMSLRPSERFQSIPELRAALRGAKPERRGRGCLWAIVIPIGLILMLAFSLFVYIAVGSMGQAGYDSGIGTRSDLDTSEDAAAMAADAAAAAMDAATAADDAASETAQAPAPGEANSVNGAQAATDPVAANDGAVDPGSESETGGGTGVDANASGAAEEAPANDPK